MNMEEEEEKLLSTIAASDPNAEPAPMTTDSDSDSSAAADQPPSAVEYQISDEHKQLRERHQRAKQQLLLKRRASALAVPTNDTAVRSLGRGSGSVEEGGSGFEVGD